MPKSDGIRIVTCFHCGMRKVDFAHDPVNRPKETALSSKCQCEMQDAEAHRACVFQTLFLREVQKRNVGRNKLFISQSIQLLHTIIPRSLTFFDDSSRLRQWLRTDHGHCLSTCMSRLPCACLRVHYFFRQRTTAESALYFFCRMDSRGSESSYCNSGATIRFNAIFALEVARCV